MAAAISTTGSAPRIVVHAFSMWRLSGRNRPAKHAAVLLRRGAVRHVPPADADEPFRSAQNVGARAPREIASFGLDRSAYDHLRIAQQSQSIPGANRKNLSNQSEAATATFGLRPVAQ